MVVRFVFLTVWFYFMQDRCSAFLCYLQETQKFLCHSGFMLLSNLSIENCGRSERSKRFAAFENDTL